MSEVQKIKPIQISVVIPAYNIEPYIERAINSILVQTHQPGEIVVVDDGSTDATAQKIKAYGDKVRYIYQDNRGLSGARNTGIREAKYDWVAFLDGDDEWLPDHLRLQTALLKQNPELKWSTGNFIRCLCEEGRRGEDIRPEIARSLMKGKDYFACYFYAHAHGAAGHPDTVVIHKEIFEKIGFFNERQAFAEDIEMWWRIAFEYPSIGYVAEPIAVYHLQRPGTLTEEFNHKKHQWLVRLLEDNLKYATEHQQGEQFAPVVKHLVTSWIRGLLFENRPDQIKQLLSKYAPYLSPVFKMIVSVLMVWPKGAAWLCHFISRIVRALKLRRKIVRPPSLTK